MNLIHKLQEVEKKMLALPNGSPAHKSALREYNRIYQDIRLEALEQSEQREKESRKTPVKRVSPGKKKKKA